ncbi:MAG: metallophosphoesterase [Bacteroidales bacterium]|nr:metallophosphoesterase [Bacteroidales bacterium]
MKKLKVFTVCLVSVVFTSFYSGTDPEPDSCAGDQKAWTIVSFPDFFNFDVPEPWPQWDDAVNWFLDQVSKEDPEFVLVTGDLVNGHWYDGPTCIEHMGATYFGNFIRRMNHHQLRYYVAVGDHELGDDPWPPEKMALVPHFERAFAENLKMPLNGPENKKGLAYSVRHKNVLVVTVETFEEKDGELIVTVTGRQLDWLRQTLSDNRDADFIIVQGHAPVIGRPKARSSSMLMVKDSSDSEFWKVMKQGGVDLYLCGEFHAVTINEKDGIWQVVHGSSWGREIVSTQDYLVMKVEGRRLNLEMKSFPMKAQGDYMWNLHKDRGPQEIVVIPDEVKAAGPGVTGTLTIDKRDGKENFSNVSGCFLQD